MKSSSIKIAITLNYLSLTFIVLFYEYALINNWRTGLLATNLISIFVLLISFYVAYYKTGLWGFTHKKFNDMDERELQVSGQSLQNAYSVFSISILLILFINALFPFRISIVLAVSLLYFAHILPASILAWKKSNI